MISKNIMNRFPILILLGFALAACQTTTSHKAQTSIEDIGGKTVVIMPFDVELSELTAGGATEPRADWTQTAEGLIKQVLKEKFGGANISLVYADEIDKPANYRDMERRVIKFHSVVGGNILLHKTFGFRNLPTKKDKFDWTLAEKVGLIRENYDGDYALFVFVRDSYTSAGRAALIAFGAVLGVGIQGGQQVGYASLVDLKSGDIEWFNFLHSASGDLRKAEGATKTVDGLLADFPAQ